jgi:hypothetical protein
MPTNLPLLHPSSLPHSDTLGVPTWLQWLVVAIALAIGGWLVLEARADRRARSAGEPAASEGEEDGPSSRRLVRAKPAAPSQKTSRPAAATRGSLSPPSLLVLVIGVVAGWSAIDRVRAVDALAGFIRTDGAAQVVRLGFCFAALLWVGAALAPVASRGAAVACGVAGVIWTFLTVPSRWARRL